MRIQRRLGKLTAIAWLLTSIAAVGIVSAQPPGACNTPVSERTSEIGCYLTATQSLGLLPQSRYFWGLPLPLLKFSGGSVTFYATFSTDTAIPSC
jgi:hypothetical protein